MGHWKGPGYMSTEIEEGILLFLEAEGGLPTYN